jgi:hypothetical protein
MVSLAQWSVSREPGAEKRSTNDLLQKAKAL